MQNTNTGGPYVAQLVEHPLLISAQLMTSQGCGFVGLCAQ